MRYRFSRLIMFILLLSGVCNIFILSSHPSLQTSPNRIPHNADAPPPTTGTTNLGFIQSNESVLVQYPSEPLQTNVTKVFNPNGWNITQINSSIGQIFDANYESYLLQNKTITRSVNVTRANDIGTQYPCEIATKLPINNNVNLKIIEFGFGLDTITLLTELLYVQSMTIDIKTGDQNEPSSNIVYSSQFKDAIITGNDQYPETIGKTIENGILQDYSPTNKLFMTSNATAKISTNLDLSASNTYWFIINGSFHNESSTGRVMINTYNDSKDDLYSVARKYDSISWSALHSAEPVWDVYLNLTYKILDQQLPSYRDFRINNTILNDNTGMTSFNLNSNKTIDLRYSTNRTVNFVTNSTARLMKNFTYALNSASYSIDINTNVITATKTLTLTHPYVAPNNTINRVMNCTIPNGWTLDSVSVGNIDQQSAGVASISGIGASPNIILTLFKSGVINMVTTNLTDNTIQRGMSYEVTASGSGVAGYLDAWQYDPTSVITASLTSQNLNTALVFTPSTNAILGTHAIYTKFDDGNGGIGYKRTTIMVFDYVDVTVNLTDSLGRPIITNVWLNGTNVQITNASGFANWTHIYAPQTLNVSWDQQGINHSRLISLNNAQNITIQSDIQWIYTVQQEFIVQNKTGGALPCNVSINNVKYATDIAGKVTITLNEGSYNVNVVLPNGTTIKTMAVTVVKNGAPIIITTDYVMPVVTNGTTDNPTDPDTPTDDTLFGLPTSLVYVAGGLVVVAIPLAIVYKKIQKPKR